MLYYKDGRFAADKIFSFFALNYITRKRNNSSGKWFVEKFQEDCATTLDELKDRIAKGDTKFVNGLTYWNKRVKGSANSLLVPEAIRIIFLDQLPCRKGKWSSHLFYNFIMCGTLLA